MEADLMMRVSPPSAYVDKEKPSPISSVKKTSATTKNEIATMNNSRFLYEQDHINMKLYFSAELQDLLHPCRSPCTDCREGAFKGLFYRDIHKLPPDQAYTRLLPFFAFKCSHKSCYVKLKWHEVAEHEKNCFFKSQTRPELANPEDDDGVAENDAHIFTTNPCSGALSSALSCNLCLQPLTAFPIVSDGNLIICGRCKPPQSTSDWIEQRTFQFMTKHLKFPCGFAMCPEVLKFDEVEMHVKNCPWKYMLCPLRHCGKYKLKREISIHIRHCHMHECHVNRMELERQKSLIKIDSEPYIVSVEADVDEQRFSCAVYGLDDKDYDDVRLEIVNADDESVLETVQMQVRVVTLLAKHELKDHVQLERHQNKNTFLRLVKVDNNGRGVALSEQSSDDLLCKICYTHMTRTIFMCENNHPICDRCKKRVDRTCPQCRGKLEADRRHFQLEQEAAKFKFPCSFQETNNCKVELTPDLLTRHEVVCRRLDGFSNCFIVGCEAKFNSYRYDAFFNHCAQHHVDSMMYSDSKEVLKWSTEHPKVDRRAVMFYEGELFHILLQFDEKTGVYFGISQVVPSSRRYKYTLELRKSWRTAKKNGTCGTGSITTPNLHVEPEVVKELVNVVGPTIISSSGPTFSWIEYRAKLKHTTVDVVDRRRESVDDDDADDDFDDENTSVDLADYDGDDDFVDSSREADNEDEFVDLNYYYHLGWTSSSRNQSP